MIFGRSFRRNSSGTAAGQEAQHKALTLHGLFRKSLLVEFAVVCAVIAIPVGISMAWYENVSAGSPGGRPVVVAVKSGESATGVMDTLTKDGIVTDTLAMRVYMLLHGTPSIEVGLYRFFKHESFAGITGTLEGGPDVAEVVVQPGATIDQIAIEVSQATSRSAGSFYNAVSSAVHANSLIGPIVPSNATSMEGMVGTGTYRILPGESLDTLARQMVASYGAELEKTGLIQSARHFGITPYQAMIVASLVQEEGVYTSNMSKVARVVYNRLSKRMKLQLDTTVLYALHRSGGAVTGSDLSVQSPYNTYLHAGLPPTPIGTPSIQALDATIHPASGAWLYFVVISQSGKEAFSDTFAQQLVNEKIARRNGIL
ncbi:MAG: endolytic transglycosylase MltG [Actinobacteria bacterium]|nr:endolytic transglycosylase MltG [Actinomycetota bacterium]